MGMHLSVSHKEKHALKRYADREVDEKATLKRHGYDIDWRNNIGEGSYSKVKRGYSKKLNRFVAVKIMERPDKQDAHSNKFFPRELTILSRLRHPNVVSCKEIIEFNTKIFIVMELASEGDLLEYVRAHKSLHEKHARQIFAPVLDAVAFLHKNNIVHRDLKCENILLYKGLVPKISDFGFAKHLEHRSSLNRTFCGSSGYAAFEVLKGLPYDGMKSDIWSLGVILYVMVTASMPFDDATRQSQLRDMEEDLRFNYRHMKFTESIKHLLRGMMDVDARGRLSTTAIKNHPWTRGEGTLPYDARDSPRLRLCELAAAT